MRISLVIGILRSLRKDTDVEYRNKMWHRARMGDRLENWPDERFLRFRYRYTMGTWPDLEHPRTFNEKLQWLKLHDRNPRYTSLADKYEAKAIVSAIIGEEHVLPTLGVWDRFDDIDFDSLPDRFMLKTTHDSGGYFACPDRASFDGAEAKSVIEERLSNRFYLSGREWPYKDIVPRIIAEPYIDSLGKPDSREYRLDCTNGIVRNIGIWTGATHGENPVRYNDNYDRDFNHLDWCAGYPNAPVEPAIPPQIDEMIEYAELLSKDIPHVRIDFYLIDGAVYFGEMTFFPFSGLADFNPPEQDAILGSWIELPEKDMTA